MMMHAYIIPLFQYRDRALESVKDRLSNDDDEPEMFKRVPFWRRRRRRRRRRRIRIRIPTRSVTTDRLCKFDRRHRPNTSTYSSSYYLLGKILSSIFLTHGSALFNSLYNFLGRSFVTLFLVGTYNLAQHLNNTTSDITLCIRLLDILQHITIENNWNCTYTRVSYN